MRIYVWRKHVIRDWYADVLLGGAVWIYVWRNHHVIRGWYDDVLPGVACGSTCGEIITSSGTGTMTFYREVPCGSTCGEIITSSGTGTMTFSWEVARPSVDGIALSGRVGVKRLRI